MMKSPYYLETKIYNMKFNYYEVIIAINEQKKIIKSFINKKYDDFTEFRKKQKTLYRYGDEKMSEYKKKVIELIESNLTGYEISKKTGVSQYVLSQLRQGKREVDNLTLNTTEKLYEYANIVL